MGLARTPAGRRPHLAIFGGWSPPPATPIAEGVIGRYRTRPVVTCPAQARWPAVDLPQVVILRSPHFPQDQQGDYAPGSRGGQYSLLRVAGCCPFQQGLAGEGSLAPQEPASGGLH